MSNGEPSGLASGNGQGSRVVSGDGNALSGGTYTAQRLVRSLYFLFRSRDSSDILCLATLLPRTPSQDVPAFLHRANPCKLARQPPQVVV